MEKFESIHLDKNSTEPLYIQIYKGFSNLIMSGQIKHGEKLPPIRLMASFFDVNTVTIVNAYKKLQSDGFVKSKVGSGTYACFLGDISSKPKSSDKLVNLSKDKGIRFDFSAGSISPDYFPVKEFKEIINEILDRDGGYALEYQESSGYQPLKESIGHFMSVQHDTDVPLDEIQIISGAQQGIDLIAKAFLNNGDIVYVEAPTYPGAINAFKSRNARIIEINMEKDGVDLEDLKRNIKNNPPVLFYTMPIFQNPTGYSYSIEKKKELIALSCKYNFYIIEDDHISDLYYTEKPSLLKAFDSSEKVFYIKSFSKLFLPGLRIAFLAVPRRHFNKIALAKYSSDISTSGLSQRILDLFLRKSLWSMHINRLQRIFYEKWQETLKAFDKYMPSGVNCFAPGGGHFFWITLPKGLYSSTLYHEAIKKGVSIVPGDLFFINQKPSESFRLSTAQISTSDISSGIKLLSESIQSLIDNTGGVFRGPGDKPLL